MKRTGKAIMTKGGLGFRVWWSCGVCNEWWGDAVAWVLWEVHHVSYSLNSFKEGLYRGKYRGLL